MTKQDMVWQDHNTFEEITICTMIKKRIIGIKKVKRASLKTIHNVKKDQNLDLKMVLYTKVNGKEMSDMVMVYKSGPMEQNMKDIGRIIRHMVKEYFGMYMVINMKDGGKETKPMDTVNIPTVMELPMRVIGKMISSTVKE